MVYMDDDMIACKSVSKEIEMLFRCLDVLRKVNLILNLSKCKFLQEKIEFIAYELYTIGVKPDKLQCPNKFGYTPVHQFDKIFPEVCRKICRH